MILTLWLLVAAPFIGSFLGVVVTRFDTSDSPVSGRSKCRDCHTQLAVQDMIPVFSWFVLRGKCRQCGADIPRTYPVCEVGALVVALWAVAVVDAAFVLPSCLLGWALMTLSLIDIRVLRIPNILSGFVLLSGLVTTVIYFKPTMIDHGLGVIAGFTVLFVVRHAYFRFRGRRGLGNADERLLGAGGAWIGLTGIFSALFLAALFGVLMICVARVSGRKIGATEAIPFGPFLATGVWLTWLYGPILLGG